MKSICIFLIFLTLYFFTTTSNAANTQPCNDPTCLESLSRNDRIQQIADLCPSFSATEGCVQTFMLPPRYNVSAKIAIIGAGMSGILTARKLAQFGYTNITIFEAADSIGGYTQSKKIDGRFYDYQAHLFSSRYWDTRFHPDLTKILQETPFPFREEDFQWRNTTKEILPPCLETIAAGLVYRNGSLNGPAVAQFIQNIIITQTQLTNSFWGQVGEGGPGSIRTPNMDLSWPNYKLNFNPVSNCIHDTLLNALQLNLPQLPTAVTVNLNSLLQLTLPATVGKLFDLKFSGASYSDEWSEFLAQLPSTLRVSLVHSEIFATFTGFNNWIQKISDRLAWALEDTYVIRTGTTVKSLTGGSKVEIEDQHGSTSKFDVAIITTRPRDTRAYVQSPALQSLFSEANCPTFWSRSVIVQSESDAHPPACSNNNFGIGFWVLEPYATLSGNDSNAVLNKFTSCDRQNEKNIWVCHASTTQSTSSADAWRVGKAQLQDYGFGDSERLAEVVSNYPVFPKAQNNWYQSASLLQGVDNIFFGGELMSGPGLESIIDYVYKAIPQWFSIVQEV